jgi:hypothetical protein
MEKQRLSSKKQQNELTPMVEYSNEFEQSNIKEYISRCSKLI